jgi:hypothetical protein
LEVACFGVNFDADVVAGIHTFQGGGSNGLGDSLDHTAAGDSLFRFHIFEYS